MIIKNNKSNNEKSNSSIAGQNVVIHEDKKVPATPFNSPVFGAQKI